MVIASDRSAPLRRWDWRRLIERGTLVRHPVSVARRRLGGVLLVLMLLGFVRYVLVTRDEAIRQRAVAFLQEATPGGVDVSVGRAAFHMFGGIELEHVRVSVPYDRRLDPQAVDALSRTIFSAESLTLIHNPWYLLLGKLRVERVVAVEPTIRLVHNADTGLRNWQLLWSGPLKVTSPKPGVRPLVTLRSAKAVVVSVDRSGRHVSPEERLDADIRPHPQTATGYDIEVRRYTKPIERTTMLFDPGQRLVANTPFVDARTVLLQLPTPAQALFNSIQLKGEVRLTRMLYDATSPSRRQTQIELRRVNCKFPFGLLDAAALSSAEAQGEQGASSQATVGSRFGRRAEPVAHDGRARPAHPS